MNKLKQSLYTFTKLHKSSLTDVDLKLAELSRDINREVSDNLELYLGIKDYVSKIQNGDDTVKDNLFYIMHPLIMKTATILSPAP